MERRARWAKWAAVSMVAAAACQQPSAGGQSGTDGDTGQACPVISERAVGFDERTPAGSATEIRAHAERTLAASPEIGLQWHDSVGGATTLTIELEDWGPGATFVESAGGVCDHLRVPATLRLATADGLLDVTIAGEFRGPTHWIGRLDPDVARDVEALQRLARSFGRSDLGLMDLGAAVEFESLMVAGELFASTSLDDDVLAQALQGLAHFRTQPEDSEPPEVVATDEPYERPPSFAEACSAAQPTEPGLRAFGSDEELVSALAGAWILCTSRSSHAVPHHGIALASDGTWKHLLERDGALVEQLGFHHEGTYRVIDTSSINAPNSRQLDIIVPLEYGFSRDRRTLQLVRRPDPLAPSLPSYDNVYVRTDLPVSPAQPARRSGERAGAAACEEGEACVHRFGSLDELRSVLVGTWVVCSGGLHPGASGIAFADDGSYAHLDDDGEAVASGRYELRAPSMSNRPEDAMPGVYFAVDGVPAPGPRAIHSLGSLLVSDAPIKLMVVSDRETVLSAVP